MICPKCQNANLADASGELDDGSDETEWLKCFMCGWRGRPIMGRPTVTEQDLEDDEDAGDTTATMRAPGKRHCHAPGRKHRFCSAYPVKGQDYCKKHLAMKDQNQKPLRICPGDSVMVAQVMKATDLDDVILKMENDLAALNRAREILLTYSGAQQ